MSPHGTLTSCGVPAEPTCTTMPVPAPYMVLPESVNELVASMVRVLLALLPGPRLIELFPAPVFSAALYERFS